MEQTKTTRHADASESPNVVTGTSTICRSAFRSTFNSTTPEDNGNKRENIVTESSQRDDPQAAQPAAPQVNDDDDDGNRDNNVLTRNLDANEFENVAN